MTGDIFIYGVIGDEQGEISAEFVRDQLKANNASKEITLHIISPGGDVFTGQSIYNALKNSGKKITTHIEGTCASIATLIAAAGDKVIMNKTAEFMIHNPNIDGLSGDSRKLRSVANHLDQIKTLLIDVYERKTKLSKERLWELYDNETWLTAEAAHSDGFVDEVVDAIKAVAKINITKFENEMKDQKKIDGLMARITNFFKAAKIKNEATETLEDGTVIIVLSDDGGYTGKQVMYESGEPLPPGDYKLAAGRMLVVGEGSVITEVKEAEVENKTDKNDSDEMEKDKQIEALKAELAALKAEKETASASAVTAKAETLKFKNRVDTLEKDFLALKEVLSETAGDKTDPDKGGPSYKNQGKPQEDPMGDFALNYFRNRNIIVQDND